MSIQHIVFLRVKNIYVLTGGSCGWCLFNTEDRGKIAAHQPSFFDAVNVLEYSIPKYSEVRS